MRRRQFLNITAASTLLSMSNIAMSKESTDKNPGARKIELKPMNEYPYEKPAGTYPQPEFITDSLRLHFGSALLDRRNLFVGFDENLIAYGMAPDPIGREELIDFYSAVFDSFPDFRLVDDSLLVAGDMGAHQYHALGTLGGVGGADARQIMFRGQTIYRINQYGRVIWRISNHDHGFRESQIAYATNNRLEKGLRSWVPSAFADQNRMLEPPQGMLSEIVIRDKLSQLLVAASNTKQRDQYWDFYREDAQIHGLNVDHPLQTAGLNNLKDEYSVLWNAIPDLTYLAGQLIVCEDHAVQQWYATGHHTGGKLKAKSADGRKLILREQTIYRFDKDYQIIERWINHDHEYLQVQLS